MQKSLEYKFQFIGQTVRNPDMVCAMPGFLPFFADPMCCVPYASNGSSRIRRIICKKQRSSGIEQVDLLPDEHAAKLRGEIGMEVYQKE